LARRDDRRQFTLFPRQHFAPLSEIHGQCNEISVRAVKLASNPLFLLLLLHP
jgi:hypothetical protein